MIKSGVNRHGGLDFIKICRLAPVAYRGGELKESSRTAKDFGSQTPAIPVAYRYNSSRWAIAYGILEKKFLLKDGWSISVISKRACLGDETYPETTADK
ncbi:hypothetical protein E3N88_20137 [Mikania micrantha]|uniref:Uncharacterized protein n=1 Tax=Mikania micrantha TaxID=192012 RepID=A0A5N6NGL8_9ASTR|nr:hypothetical protein E3N88_20137 [Mikania micrantha]